MAWTCTRHLMHPSSHLMQVQAGLLASRRGTEDAHDRNPMNGAAIKRRKADVHAWNGSWGQGTSSGAKTAESMHALTRHDVIDRDEPHAELMVLACFHDSLRFVCCAVVCVKSWLTMESRNSLRCAWVSSIVAPPESDAQPPHALELTWFLVPPTRQIARAHPSSLLLLPLLLLKRRMWRTTGRTGS